MLKLKSPIKLKTSSECTTVVVDILNPIIRIKTVLNGVIEPSKHGQHHPQQDWCPCSLLVIVYELHMLYILNHSSCKSLKGQIPLTKLYGITPDISIIMMYTFYQPVYYASHNPSFPSTSEDKHAFWVGFGEHVGDAITHKLLDSSSNKILYHSAV